MIVKIGVVSAVTIHKLFLAWKAIPFELDENLVFLKKASLVNDSDKGGRLWQ